MAKGSVVQSWSSTGTTSVWPESTIPPGSSGPMVAKRLALVPPASCCISTRAPAADRRSARNTIISRLLSDEMVGKAISRSRSSTVSPSRSKALVLHEELALDTGERLGGAVLADQDGLGGLQPPVLHPERGHEVEGH